MITYNAKDLIKRAKQLADLENSDFISWNEQINLLNENYVALYQKLCNIGDEAFIREFSCGVGVTELPVDYFQLKSVSLNNHGNIIPILRRAETQSYNDCYYELKNGKLIIGGYSGEYIVKYFPQPMTLIFKPEAVKIEDALLSYFTENTVLNAFDKRYFLSNGSILDIEEASVIGTTGESTEDTGGFISVMDNSKIVTKGYIYNYNKTVYANGLIEQWGNGVTSRTRDVNVSLFVTFSNTDYCILASYGYRDNAGSVGYNKNLKTTNSFRLGSDGENIPLLWKVEGY